MAAGTSIPLSPEALHPLATRLEQELAEVAARVAPTGAYRRGEPTRVLEFIALPTLSAADLFGAAEPDVRAIRDCMGRWGQTVRRGDGAFVCQLATPAQAQAQAQVVVHCLPAEAQWGVAMAYHTGPAAFFDSLAEQLREKGLLLNRDAFALRDARGAAVAVADEEALFRLAGRELVTPQERGAAVRARIAADLASRPADEPVERYRDSDHQGRGMPIERD